MIELKNLIVDKKPSLPDGTAVVHPFYRTSFLKLSGLAEEDVALLELAAPPQNEDFLVPLLCAASAGYEREITRFYDVRTTEEYGRAAPEYALLARSGLRRVSPLGVKGRNALPFALELAEEQLRCGETVLFCCAELYTPLDGPRRECRAACAFLLCGYESEETQKNRTLLLQHRCNVPKEDVQGVIARLDGALICSDDGNLSCGTGGRYVETTGLIQPFAALMQARENTDVLVISHDGGRYDYLHIHKGDASS